MKRVIALLFACLSSGWLMANHWTPVGAPYEENMPLTCVVQLDGMEQQGTTLELGAFCGDECRGSQLAAYFEPEQRYIYQMTVFGEEGDMLTFRLFDHATGQELDLESPAPVAFDILGYGTLPDPVVLNFGPTAITPVVTLSPGWNWWSGYIELDGNSLQSLENGLGGNGLMIKSQNDGYASYLAGFGWYGSLAAINNENTYQIRASEACTVEMTGAMANPADHPVTLVAGWNWIGYPVSASMTITEALSGITPQSGDMLKSQNDGYASYLAGYGWYGSLSTLNPGMGLMYKSNAGADIVLTYPEGGTRGDLKSNQTAEGNHWQPDLNAYPDNMSVTAIVELDGSELRSERYELAAFANGECRGSARLMYVEPLDRYMAFLTVAGDEAAELRFSLYDAETGTVETQNFASLQYETNAVVGSFEEPCVVSFRSTTGVDEWANGMQVYPNPIEHGQLLTIGFMEEEACALRIEIINALGAVVETESAPSVRTIAAPKTAGVYTLRVTVEGKGTCYRKLVVR